MVRVKRRVIEISITPEDIDDEYAAYKFLDAKVTSGDTITITLEEEENQED